MELMNLVKIFLPTAVAFFLGLFFTPLATHFFFKYKMWKKHSRDEVCSDEFRKIHNGNDEIKTPRVGGIIIWVSVALTTVFFYLILVFFPSDVAGQMNFL